MGIILEKLPGITKGLPGGELLLTTADYLIDLGRRSSMWPMTFGLACCAIEMMGSYASRFDFDRMGVIPRASPRQADVMIVAGTVVKKMAEPILEIYHQMPEPRFVISWAAAPTAAGPLRPYSVFKGVDHRAGRRSHRGLPASARGPAVRRDRCGEDQEDVWPAP